LKVKFHFIGRRYDHNIFCDWQRSALSSLKYQNQIGSFRVSTVTNSSKQVITGPPKAHQNVCVRPNENCPDRDRYLSQMVKIVRIWPHTYPKNHRKSPKMLFLQLNCLLYAMNTLANVTARINKFQVSSLLSISCPALLLIFLSERVRFCTLSHI
jgi:hypothetical protein